jgi:glucosylglycerate phosphorylase
VNAILDHLTYLYGPSLGQQTFQRLQHLLASHPARPAPSTTDLSQGDSLLITYGDQVQTLGQPHLATLAGFCRQHLSGAVSGVHILPFYPWTSDDGFSVKDYRAIDPALGTWADVAKFSPTFRLMFDGVINHISSESDWFQKFLHNDPTYEHYFILVEGDPDLSQVVRPRALPLLTPYQTPSGPVKVWTTFSADQIDLNYANPDVLLEIIDILLLYIEEGAQFIRLDAIAYLWKEIGTSCLHLPQTHRVIQLLRAVLDEVAPSVRLITETNVPHADNISYFGPEGTREAQLVYNFALPPLTLHTLRTGNAQTLSHWAANLDLPSNEVTFFNFLASHDGIGLNPARGLLSPAEIDSLVQGTLDRGGLISYKDNPDGTQSPYEMNINYFDALSLPADTPSQHIDRFLVAQSIMLALVGLPGIYFHSLFGSQGWPEGVKQTGRSRTINRQKSDLVTLEKELADPASQRSQIFNRYRQLLAARAASPAFHPHGTQRVLDAGPALFALLRTSPDSQTTALCLHNVSNQPQTVHLDWSEFFQNLTNIRDLITGNIFDIQSQPTLSVKPYQVLWLT